MEISTAYMPHEILAPPGRDGLPAPRVFIAPARYIQGRGVLRSVGRYLTLLKPKRAALLMSARGLRGDGATLLASPFLATSAQLRLCPFFTGRTTLTLCARPSGSPPIATEVAAGSSLPHTV